MRIAVVVVSNNWERLRYCWEALESQSFSQFCVVLADFSLDQSVTKSLESSRLNQERRVHALSAKHTTVNQAWNRAIEQISEANPPAYVPFLNDDSRPKPTWLECLALSADRAGKRVGMFASMLLAKCECHIRSAGHTIVIPWGRPDCRYKEPVMPGLEADPVPIVPCGVVPCGAAALYRWELIEQLRGQYQEQFMDEEIEHYWTCLDIGIKAQILGWTSELVSDAVVVDAGFEIDGVKTLNDRAERLQQESRLALTVKFVPPELLPEELNDQITHSMAHMLKRGKGAILAEALEKLCRKRESLLEKRSKWAKIAAELQFDTVKLLCGRPQ